MCSQVVSEQLSHNPGSLFQQPHASPLKLLWVTIVEKNEIQQKSYGWFCYNASNTYLHWSCVCLPILFLCFCYPMLSNCPLPKPCSSALYLPNGIPLYRTVMCLVHVDLQAGLSTFELLHQAGHWQLQNTFSIEETVLQTTWNPKPFPSNFIHSQRPPYVWQKPKLQAQQFNFYR